MIDALWSALANIDEACELCDKNDPAAAKAYLFLAHLSIRQVLRRFQPTCENRPALAVVDEYGDMRSPA